MATYQFGVVETGISLGLIQSINYTSNQELAEAKDHNGCVAKVNGYNDVIDVTAEVIYDTETSLPAIGSSVQITTGKFTGYFRVISLSVVESNTDFCRANLTLKKYVTNTIPAS